MKKLLFAFLALSLLAACNELSTTRAKSLSLDRVISGQKLTTSSAASLSAHDNYALTIEKSSLGSLFKMSAAVVENIPNPVGNHLNEKIVYFKKNGNTFGLFELTDDRYETSAIKTEVLLTTFPIIIETSTALTIDFNKGMSKLFYAGSMYTSDFDDGPEQALSISDSYVDKVKIINNVLYIDQFVRVNLPDEEGKISNSALRIKYNFQTYEKNEKFPSKLSEGMEKIGYFEVAPLIEAGTTERIIKIAKYDITKPIIFYLSRNTPEEMIQPLTDAVLYWNKAFKEATGKEPLQVKMLPQGVDLYTPGYNIIQWMDNDAAGAAYADIQADPLTGEINRTNIYMPSIFATDAEWSAPDLLLQMSASGDVQKIKEKKGLVLKHFSSSRFIESYNVAERVSEINAQLNEFLASEGKNLSDEEKSVIVKRYRDDAVRETVAHEVGHCMGLRHNFAASTQTNITTKNFHEHNKTTFLTGTPIEGAKAGSSLMDYNAPAFAAIIGANIRLKAPALSYDLEAIKWGYTEEEMSDADAGVFCTDSQLMTGLYADCKQFDQMASAIEGSAFGYSEVVKKLSFLIANDYSRVIKNTNLKDKVSAIKKILRNPMTVSNSIMKSYNKLVGALSPTAQSIGLLQDFGAVTYYNQGDYLEQTKDLKREDLKKLGTLSQVVLADFTPAVESGVVTLPLVEKMKALVKTNSEALYGTIISDAERVALNETTDRFFKNLTSELLLLHTQILAKSTFFEMDETFAASLQDDLEKILFTKESAELIRNADGTKIVLKPALNLVRGQSDLRAQAVVLSTHDFFPTDASYLIDARKISNALWNKFVTEMNELNDIIGSGVQADRTTLNWLVLETKRFAPLNPNN